MINRALRINSLSKSHVIRKARKRNWLFILLAVSLQSALLNIRNWSSLARSESSP